MTIVKECILYHEDATRYTWKKQRGIFPHRSMNINLHVAWMMPAMLVWYTGLKKDHLMHLNNAEIIYKEYKRDKHHYVYVLNHP